MVQRRNESMSSDLSKVADLGSISRNLIRKRVFLSTIPSVCIFLVEWVWLTASYYISLQCETSVTNSLNSISRKPKIYYQLTAVTIPTLERKFYLILIVNYYLNFFKYKASLRLKNCVSIYLRYCRSYTRKEIIEWQEIM